MKKLAILTAVLLLGVGSVFAGPWEVLVEWSYQYPYYCTSQLSNEYELVITLDIYDVANNEQITDTPTYNIEDWDETETTFTELQTKVEDWCGEAPDTPNLKVTTTVSIVHKTTQDVFCSETVIVYKTCLQFSSGIPVSIVFN